MGEILIVHPRSDSMFEKIVLRSEKPCVVAFVDKSLVSLQEYMTIEETFRDEKDPRFGMGLSQTRVRSTDRRDRLLLLAAVAHALLTLLGAAGERVGLDRTLKVNTVKRRTMSLFNQGTYWYSAIPNMRQERLELLMPSFDETIREHAVFNQVFGLI